MHLRKAAAPARHLTADQAAALVRPGMWLDYGAMFCQPDAFDAALGLRVPELADIGIRSCLSLRPRAVLEADPQGRCIDWVSQHFSGYDRRQHDAGRAGYQPVNLGEVPDYYRRFIPPVDMVILKCRPADADGWFNFSAANLWHRAILERAACVVIEVNDQMPHAMGEGNGVHISEVDYILDGDGAAAPELPNPPPGEVDIQVGRLIAAEIDHGACLQIGIGGMPNAVCTQLLDSPARDFGVHTEMLTDGLAALYRAGRITGARKATHPGKLVYSFALGSAELYQTLHNNPDMACLAVDRTNLPQNIMANPQVVAINNTTQIDLQGQCASESDGHRHLTGTGGQLQFVRGGYASEGGKSFICLSSTYERRGTRRSRIVLSLTPGNIVTAPRTDVMYVVTEYGLTNLKGKSVAERARALIALAHPDFREELAREAHHHRLIPRAFPR